ncbi:MAG: radical SAM protein, partial [Planctomycetales bacterium]|nr:radical SAM protein [Planctomycetales bacterium]
MRELTLLRRNAELAQAAAQVQILESPNRFPLFDEHLDRVVGAPLRAQSVDVLQVNVGKMCNQTCRHCHVDAGPDRREAMSQEVASACIRALEVGEISTLDITGGAPEMNPVFEFLVVAARRLGRRVIDRCNLT